MKILLFLSISFFLTLSCALQEEEKKGFQHWYENRYDKEGFYRDYLTELPALDSFVISTGDFRMDSLCPPLQGPYQDLKFNIPAKDSLIWLCAYKVESMIVGEEKPSKSFIDHNSLNFDGQLLMPWRHELNYFNLRVFTIGSDAEAIQLPKGFGIPVYKTQNFSVEAQSMSLNMPAEPVILKQKITIYYYPESKLKRRMIPLEQRIVFAFKQYEGPEGLYGEPEHGDNYTLRQQFEVTQPGCTPNEIAKRKRGYQMDLFHDPYGRLFTGHWKLPPGSEDFTIDISSLLQLEKATKLHYINAIAHPACENISLIDLTSKKTVFEAQVNVSHSGGKINSISKFSSTHGTAVFPDHKYAIRSVYDNNTRDTLSARAVLYLYMQI